MDTHYGRKEAVWRRKLIQGTTPGQKRRGRPKTNWHDNITEWTELKGKVSVSAEFCRRQKTMAKDCS